MNLQNIMAAIAILRTLAPALAELVRTIEELFPEPGAGPRKLDLLKGLLVSLAQGSADVEAELQQNMPLIEKTVTWLVGAYNLLGKFRTGA